MERIGRALRSLLKHLKDARGVSLYEITAAVAMTGILAAVAVPVIIDKVQEAKAARTAQETDALYKALSAFQRDTGKMPGEVEKFKLLVSSTQGSPTANPPLSDSSSVTCTTLKTVGTPASAGTRPTGCANINDFLVRNPNTSGTNYQNWRGPYIDEITSDPFDRAYVVNIGALYSAEGAPVTADVASNTCGYGWVLSGGPNRTLETKLTDTNFKPESDDLGKNYGKKQPPGPGCSTG